MGSETVHNHGPAEGRGLDCPEYRVGGPFGRLRGACQPEADTPIYDALVLEHREANAAGDLAEGRALVAGIHERNGYAYGSWMAEHRAALAVTPPASLVKIIGGLFR